MHKPENSKWHWRREQALDKWCKWSLSHKNLSLEALCSLNLGRAYKGTLSWRCISMLGTRTAHFIHWAPAGGGDTHHIYLTNRLSGSLCWSEPITGHVCAVDTPERCDSWTNCGALAGIRGASLWTRGNTSRFPVRLHTHFDLEGIYLVLKVRERYQERCYRRH